MNLEQQIAERKRERYAEANAEKEESKIARGRNLRLKKMTEELIASVISSPVALARLSGPIQKR